jgi:hypothetical protein
MLCQPSEESYLTTQTAKFPFVSCEIEPKCARGWAKHKLQMLWYQEEPERQGQHFVVGKAAVKPVTIFRANAVIVL